MSDITRDDIDNHFKAWSRSRNPRRSPVPGFVDWAYDVADQTATELGDGEDDDIVSEIVYSVRQTEEHRGADKADVRPAAQAFVDDYREELIEALREVA